MEWPRISIVTPCLNAAAYLEQALDSVLGQGYPELQYVVVDGGSTDGTLDVIRRHERHLSAWVSEPDRGHADALNKGFARTNGAVMGWLNADDLLHRGSLRLLGRLFARFPEMEWLTGQASHMDEGGSVLAVGPAREWSRLAFLSGEYRWIQQESTYWRRSLWDRAGGRLSESVGLACDFELWVRFFRHARLHSTEGLIGAFRYHPTQATATRLADYEQQAHQVRMDELATLLESGLPLRDEALWAAAPAILKYDWRTRDLQPVTIDERS